MVSDNLIASDIRISDDDDDDFDSDTKTNLFLVSFFFWIIIFDVEKR